MKEAPGSSKTSVLTRATWRNTPEDTILHKLISFIILPLTINLLHLSLRNMYHDFPVPVKMSFIELIQPALEQPS
jgi:hypothetical protein